MDVEFAHNLLLFTKQSAAVIAAQQQRMAAMTAEREKTAADKASAAALSKQVADQLISAGHVQPHLRALTETKLASHLGSLEAYSTLLGNLAAAGVVNESTGAAVPSKQASAETNGKAESVNPHAKSDSIMDRLVHRRRA